MKQFKQIKPIKFIPKEQVDKLISLIHSSSYPNAIRDSTIFTISFYRGLRRSEPSLLQLEDYDRKRKMLLVSRLKGSDTNIWYDLVKPEIKSLEEYLKIRGNLLGPLFLSKYSFTEQYKRKEEDGSIRLLGVRGGYLENVMKKFATFAGIPKDLAHFHVLKHSICVYLLDEGMGIEEVKDWVGHKSISTTQIYAKVSSKKRREMTEKIDRRLEEVKKK
jgi:integrase/recombinase XerD